MDAFAFLAALGAALSGSFHCAGMCGGFVLAASGAGARPPSCGLNVRAGRRVLFAQAAYHLGKATTYVFLGACAGWVGASAARIGAGAVRGLSLLAGLLLVAVGASVSGLLPRLSFAALGSSGLARRIATAGWTQVGSGILALRSPLVPLYLGVFSGLLPCPLVYAFAARAAAAPGFADSVLTMAALGLGTVPMLLGVALTGSALGPLVRSRLALVSGVLLVALGAWTVYRGWVGAGCCGGCP